MTVTFPNESAEYRAARDELLTMEIELRRLVEAVAAKRRSLPPGGELPEDYVFDELRPDGDVRRVRLSELFRDGQDSLILYNYMYGPQMAQPCSGCTPFMDGVEGAIPHVRQHVDFVLVARSPIERIRAFTDYRGWEHFRIVSSAHNSYNRDYFGETADGSQMPMLNVFQRDANGTVRHFWGAEVMFAPTDPGQDWRHLDTIDAAWNILDLTPEGRPEHSQFKLAYPDQELVGTR